MKRNMDLIRDILLFAEGQAKPWIAGRHPIGAWPLEEVVYNVELCADAGFLSVGKGRYPVAELGWALQIIRLTPLDADGLFHKALLQMTGTDPGAALATAEAGLGDAPDHLLLLSIAAEAEKDAGNDDAAAAHYRHILDVWEAQTTAGLAEYEAHGQMIPEIENDAQRFLEGR